MIQLRTAEVAAEVLAPKVKGTLVLAELFANSKLDFMMSCSAVASVLGGFGQIDYCAANAFLDGFASAFSASAGIPTITVNWDTWQEVGMAVTTQVPRELEALRDEALAAVARLADVAGLEAVELDVLGKKGRLTSVLFEQSQPHHSQSCDDQQQQSRKPDQAGLALRAGRDHVCSICGQD